jgi:hypothetical protein
MRAKYISNSNACIERKKIMIVYHHNDMDGKSAGYLVHTMKPKTIPDTPYSYVMMTYEDEFNKHTMRDDVFIVDLSISEKTYPRLLEVCRTARTVTWIDHHESSVEVISKHKDELQSIKNLTYFISKAACGAALTYAYFSIPQQDLKRIRQTNFDEEYEISANYTHEHISNKYTGYINVMLTKRNKKDASDAVWFDHKVKLPQWLFYVDDFDCWKLICKDTEYFKFGVETEDSAVVKYNKNNDTKYFNTKFWNIFNDNDAICNRFLTIGKSVSDFEHSENFRNLRHTFVWEYDGTQFICLNTTKKSSMSFECLMTKYPAAIAFSYSGATGTWSYSVYADAATSKFNCQKFAEKFGGGGHIGAAGFVTKKLIFTDPTYNKNTDIQPIIFLGGTCNNDNWREEFIYHWKKLLTDKRYESFKKIELFNPVVDDWNEIAQKKEEEVKATAMMNLFVITPNMKGVFSIAEAVECSHRTDCMTVFAIYDRNKEFGTSEMKSFDATGNLIKKNGGKYITAIGENSCSTLVGSIMELLVK